MHFWPNLSVTRASKLYNVKKFLANRPKGLSDEEWKVLVAEEKNNKLIAINRVPKASKKNTTTSSKRNSKD